MTGSEERQAELVEQGAGNAVADLKAGFGRRRCLRCRVGVLRGWRRRCWRRRRACVEQMGTAGIGWRRARRAEERLREVSALVGELEGFVERAGLMGRRSAPVWVGAGGGAGGFGFDVSA